MEVCTLASGSSGNSLLICCGSTYVLLDAGISARRITSALKALGADPTRLSAVLVTHEHTDHVSGLATLTKQLGVPVYATAPTLDRLERKVPALARLGRALEAGTGFQLGELWVESFSTPHDAAGSVGYAVTGGGARMALATDLGHLTPQVWDAARGADLLAGLPWPGPGPSCWPTCPPRTIPQPGPERWSPAACPPWGCGRRRTSPWR